MNDEAKDPIEAAIAVTEAPVVQVATVQVTISSTGRPFAMQIPVDMTDGEMAEVVGWMCSTVLASLRAERAKNPASRILVPRH